MHPILPSFRIFIWLCGEELQDDSDAWCNMVLRVIEDPTDEAVTSDGLPRITASLGSPKPKTLCHSSLALFNRGFKPEPNWRLAHSPAKSPILPSCWFCKLWLCNQSRLIFNMFESKILCPQVFSVSLNDSHETSRFLATPLSSKYLGVTHSDTTILELNLRKSSTPLAADTLTAWKPVSCSQRMFTYTLHLWKQKAKRIGVVWNSVNTWLSEHVKTIGLMQIWCRLHGQNSSPWWEAAPERSRHCWPREVCPTSRRKTQSLGLTGFQHTSHSKIGPSLAGCECLWMSLVLTFKACELFALARKLWLLQRSSKHVYRGRRLSRPSHLCQPSPSSRKWSTKTIDSAAQQSSIELIQSLSIPVHFVSLISTPVLSFNWFLPRVMVS